MHCPQCQSEMREIKYEGVLIDTCDGCGGEFIGSQQLTEIINRREAEPPQAAASTPKNLKPSFGVPEAEMMRTLNCPDCGSAMVVGNYGGDTGIFVDRCQQCRGVWLDCEELENIQFRMERWADEAPEIIRVRASDLEKARREAASGISNTFAGSRFAFINALINRFMDAA